MPLQSANGSPSIDSTFRSSPLLQSADASSFHPSVVARFRPLRFIVPTGGGISRFKNHLAGVSGNIRACPKAPPDVRAAMLKILGETSKKNQTLVAQKRSFSEMTRGDSSSTKLFRRYSRKQ
ncbi:hypothetical protein LINPERPRIM_LOCUS35099 [Linum perenne]